MTAHQDKAAIEVVMAALVETWDRHDGEGYGDQFTADATSVQSTQRKPLLEAISFRTAPGLVPAAQR